MKLYKNKKHNITITEDYYRYLKKNNKKYINGIIVLTVKDFKEWNTLKN